MRAARLPLSDAQLSIEIARCAGCVTKGCRDACPAGCSPADFIAAARLGAPSDLGRAAAMILAANPLGWICGAVCPDTHCMRGCSRAGLDEPVDIPAIQEGILRRAHALGAIPAFATATASGRRIAVVGAGPAGLAAAAVLVQLGHQVELFETAPQPGGALRLVPDFRLDPACLEGDLAFLAALGVAITCSSASVDPAALASTHDAVIVATGRGEPVRLGVAGEEAAVAWQCFLADPARFAPAGRRVVVVGGGAVAVDCAETAARHGAAAVALVSLEKPSEMRLTRWEREALLAAGVETIGRTRVHAIATEGGAVRGLELVRVSLPPGVAFEPRAVHDVPGTAHHHPGVDMVVVAIGSRASAFPAGARIFPAGDLVNGPTTVVEAVAAGKNAALAAAAALRGAAIEPPPRLTRSAARLSGLRRLPVPLGADFFGRPILSPLLLSAAPPTDGYAQMRRAYEAGWAGGVMKTAFDGLPIHVPAAYMVSFSPTTFGNCDNVSAHPLARVCAEIERLRREFPDRLTLGSTGGPVTGDDDADRRSWEHNTRLLESAGADGIEYSLSCPQGGDGTKGDIVSQDAELTAKIVEWVLAGGDPAVPKLFKLTAAVTAIVPIVVAIRDVLARYPHAKAGITLANSFPALAFRPAPGDVWERGVVVGMSGEGVAPISALTLAKVAGLGVVVSANGGAMDYRAVADFLALGCRTVQVCSVVMREGVEVVDELHSGLSHLLAARGLRSAGELIGRALPHPVTPFERLPARKGISDVWRELCVHCGNCTRCPYLAITLDEERTPRTDASCCVGCSFCVQHCIAGALRLRERTPEEAAAAE